MGIIKSLSVNYKRITSQFLFNNTRNTTGRGIKYISCEPPNPKPAIKAKEIAELKRLKEKYEK